MNIKDFLNDLVKIEHALALLPDERFYYDDWVHAHNGAICTVCALGAMYAEDIPIRLSEDGETYWSNTVVKKYEQYEEGGEFIDEIADLLFIRLDELIGVDNRVDVTRKQARSAISGAIDALIGLVNRDQTYERRIVAQYVEEAMSAYEVEVYNA